VRAAERTTRTVIPFAHPRGCSETTGDPNAALLGPEEMLGLIVPALADAEKVVGKLREMMDRERRRLAEVRGVAFIREEHVRTEFGGKQ
jgi:hypothetical protein